MTNVPHPPRYAVTEAIPSGEIHIHIKTIVFQDALARYLELVKGQFLTFHVYESNEAHQWYGLKTYLPIEGATKIFLAISKDRNAVLICATNHNFLLQRPGDFSESKEPSSTIICLN